VSHQNSIKEKRRRGISEIVSVIAIALVAIVAVFALRSWLSAQEGRLTGVDMATASYSVQSGTAPNNFILSVEIRNGMGSPINITSIQVVMGDGSVLSASSSGSLTLKSPQSIPFQISPKSDQLAVMSLSYTGATVKNVLVQVQDPSSGISQWISAVGG
jgi:hypothetical protein